MGGLAAAGLSERKAEASHPGGRCDRQTGRATNPTDLFEITCHVNAGPIGPNICVNCYPVVVTESLLYQKARAGRPASLDQLPVCMT